MRTLILVIGIIIPLGGCAHVRVESWGDGKVEVCGRHARAEDFERAAIDAGCAHPRAVRGGLRDDGAEVFQTGYGASVRARRAQCVTYACQ